MDIAGLKSDLIKSITSVQDVTILEKIKQFLLIENSEIDSYMLSEESLSSVNEVAEKYKSEEFSTIEEDVYIFTPEQRKRVLNSLEQSKTGNTMTDEEAQADIQKWL